MHLKRPIIIFGAIILILAAIFFSLFERQEIPATNWSTEYNLDSKEPFGLYAFANIMKQKYGESNVHIGERLLTEKLDTGKRNVVFVVSNQNSSFGNATEEAQVLLSRLRESNTIVVWMTSPLSIPQNGVRLISNGKIKLSKEKFTLSKTGKGFDYDFTKVTKDSSAINSYEIQKLYSNDDVDNVVVDTNVVESPEVNVEPNSNVDTAFVIDNETAVIDDEVVEASTDSIVDEVEGRKLERLITTPQGPVFTKIKFYDDSPYFYAHTAPVLFTNFAAKQPFFLDHLNYVLEEVKGDQFYILNNINLSTDVVNPLKYIFEQKSLKTAYYLLLALLALYLIFGSKRIFRPIPVIEEKRNTSLEYISTLARLYEYKDDNHTMVKKMQDIFYSKMYKQFYLPSHEPDFNVLLAKKSKIDISILNTVKYYFENNLKYNNCTDEDLYMLNEYLNVIYDKIKT